MPPRGDVDETQAGLGLQQQIAIDEPDRLGRLGQVDREEIGIGNDLVEREQLDAHLLRASSDTNGSYAINRMPNPLALSATSLPMRPRPTTPSVLSHNSTPSHRLRSQRPCTNAAWACGTLRAEAISRAIVCSAAETMLLCGR